MTCTDHPHSSAASAAKCYAKRMGRKADRKLRAFSLVGSKYAQQKHTPPLVTSKGGVVVFVFFGGVPT